MKCTKLRMECWDWKLSIRIAWDCCKLSREPLSPGFVIPGLPWKSPILVKACGQRCLWDGRAVCLLGSSGMWVMDVLCEKEMTDWSHKPFECTFFLHCLKQYQNWGNLLRDPAGRWALEVIHAADSCTGGFVIFIKQQQQKNKWVSRPCMFQTCTNAPAGLAAA